MTQPSPLRRDQLPRLTQPAPLQPHAVPLEINGRPFVVLILESVNGTFAFPMERDWVAENLIPLLDRNVVLTGGKTQLAGKLTVATLEDLRNLEHGPSRNVNGQGGPA